MILKPKMAYFFILFVACSSPLKTARIVLTSAAQTQVTLTEQFIAWDLAHQKDIIDKAVSIDQARQNIALYRENNQKQIIATLQSLWISMQAAESAMAIASEDSSKIAKALQSVSAVVGLLTEVQKLLSSSGVIGAQ